MPKLKQEPITQSDLSDFIRDSDFGFELQVLGLLEKNGFSCSHSATYHDPVTNKIRQFDIRAYAEHDESSLTFAVECKNVRANNPLLLSALPRTVNEAFHSTLVFHPIAHPNLIFYCTVDKETGKQSAYKADEMVGKQTDQIGREDRQPHVFIHDDRDTFEKWNQAIHSCRDIVAHSAVKTAPPFRRTIVPVLVVPDDRLWQVDYELSGAVRTQPRPVSTTTLFIDHTWSVPGPLAHHQVDYHLSHLEIVTFSAVTLFAKQWLTTLAASK